MSRTSASSVRKRTGTAGPSRYPPGHRPGARVAMVVSSPPPSMSQVPQSSALSRLFSTADGARRGLSRDGSHLPALVLQLVQLLVQPGEPGAGLPAQGFEQLSLLLQQGVPPDAVDAQAVLLPQQEFDAPVEILQILLGLIVLELGGQGLPRALWTGAPSLSPVRRAVGPQAPFSSRSTSSCPSGTPALSPSPILPACWSWRSFHLGLHLLPGPGASFSSLSSLLTVQPLVHAVPLLFLYSIISEGKAQGNPLDFPVKFRVK